MKRDDIKKLLNHPDAELEALLKAEREKLHTLRFDLHAGKVKNVAALREAKKTIARIMTALGARTHATAKH